MSVSFEGDCTGQPIYKRSMLREVGLDAERRDQAELGLEPVEVLFLAHEDLLEQLAGAVVVLLDAQRDRAVVAA